MKEIKIQVSDAEYEMYVQGAKAFQIDMSAMFSGLIKEWSKHMSFDIASFPQFIFRAAIWDHADGDDLKEIVQAVIKFSEIEKVVYLDDKLKKIEEYLKKVGSLKMSSSMSRQPMLEKYKLLEEEGSEEISGSNWITSDNKISFKPKHYNLIKSVAKHTGNTFDYILSLAIEYASFELALKDISSKKRRYWEENWWRGDYPIETE